MEREIVSCRGVHSPRGVMEFHCLRLHRGDDLLLSIQQLYQKKFIQAGVVLSAVGCISEGRLRDAGGQNIRHLREDCEIVSLTGTVSSDRCHLHISLSREDLSTIGGHLVPGCIINTTCELVVGQLPGVRILVEDDPQTGYDELVFDGNLD